MDQKTQLKSEFFELCRILNRSNSKTNQKTEIYFYIETEAGKPVLFATRNHKFKIQILRIDKLNLWKPCLYSRQFLLEESISKLLNDLNLKTMRTSDLTQLIKSLIFQKME